MDFFLCRDRPLWRVRLRRLPSTAVYTALAPMLRRSTSGACPRHRAIVAGAYAGLAAAEAAVGLRPLRRRHRHGAADEGGDGSVTVASSRQGCPSAINAISSNPRQNTPYQSVPVRLNGRREVRDSIARPSCSTEGPYRHGQNTDDIFHACRQHCGADVAVQRPIARSCPTCTRTVGTHVGAAAISRVTTELRLRGAS
jgi:hypothetical protein